MTAGIARPSSNATGVGSHSGCTRGRGGRFPANCGMLDGSPALLRDSLGRRRTHMAGERTGGNTGGIGLGGILVIVGIILMIVWSFWIGLIIALIGLIAFGGFAKGKWY